MAETPMVESDEEQPGGLDDVPGHLGSRERLNASHHMALPTRIDD